MELFDSQLSGFWNIWVTGLIVINLVLLVWLIIWTKKMSVGEEKSDDGTTGHVYDGIKELNNPLPRWWLYMLYISIAFCIAYFILYPGFGNFKGVLGWTQESQLQEETVAYDKKLAPMFAKFAKMSIKDMAKDEQVIKMGKGLFLTYCSVCHGSTAKGTKGYPDLTDKDWLAGGSPEQIHQTILKGRAGVMAPYGGIPLNEQQLENVTNYVLSLSGREHDAAKAISGKANFMICSACHGVNGEGNQAIGGPNLTDNIWLHGRHKSAIKQNIKNGFDGKANRMPSFENFLGADKVKVLSSYVYSLSN